jgi:putative hemolysin
MKGKMKRVFTFTFIFIALTACSVLQMHTPEPTATDSTPVNMPNPASVFCKQSGYDYKIITAADGSQSSICIFPDGSTCDEWAYYRGECGGAGQNSPTPALTIEATTQASGGGPGGGTPGEINASGGYMPAGTSEEISDWWGFIKSTEPGAQYDDYFERQDLGQVIYFGIDSVDPRVKAQIEALRDSGQLVHLYGTLLSNVPDYNGSQILVERIEVE